MGKVLICGQRSFVATGFLETLLKAGINYDCFSRGNENRSGNEVFGNVMNLSDNKFLDKEYDAVVNFIILKNSSVEDNLAYAKSLLDFCKLHRVKRLIQISSVSVYPNEAEYVDEQSEIEANYKSKGGYASIKVAVDHFLMDNPVEGLSVSFVRPGYVYARHHEPSKAGIVISKFGMNVLLGDKKTTLPLVCRNDIHEALVRILQSDRIKPVYLLLNKNRLEGTKYNFVAQQWNIKPYSLPYGLFMGLAKMLRKFRVFKLHHYLKVVGLFKRTWYNSEMTEKELGISFDKKKFAVIGAGTYGAYVSTLLSETYPHENIILYDVGDKQLKTEEEIGYVSHILGAPYEGLQKARFFGYGGASVKWGGQLLTFSENDFVSPTPFLQDIIELNKKYKTQVLAKFNLTNDIPETRINEHLFTKTGIWLSYFHRNLFKHFRVAKNKKIKIVPYTRVTKILANNRHIIGIEILKDGEKKIEKADQYFLTSGAFESTRLLVASGLSKEMGKMSFSDHLSQRAFKVKSGPRMGQEDFTFHVQGASLVTKRFVGEVDGYSFYSQPINNEDFPFFKDLKRLLFGHKVSMGLIGNILKNIPQCIAFAWYMIVLKKLYVYKNEFYLQIDIEAPRESGVLSLSEMKDGFGEKSINVDLSILPKTGELFTKARAYVKEYLDENGVDYEELPFSTSAEKYEDVYHPFGMFCDFESAEDYFHYFDNMLVVNTGVLPRAGGINSTCAVLPLVEEYVNRVME